MSIVPILRKPILEGDLEHRGKAGLVRMGIQWELLWRVCHVLQSKSDSTQGGTQVDIKLWQVYCIHRLLWMRPTPNVAVNNFIDL